MRGHPIHYTCAEMAWLEANRAQVISDYYRAFIEAFPDSAASMANLHALRKRLGRKVGRAPGRTAGRHWRFNTAEVAWLSDNRTLPIQDYHAGFCAEFSRTDVSAQNLHGMRKRMGWKTGRTGHFPVGGEPANKGKVCPPGTGGRSPNAQRTQFKKGQLPHNTKWAGHERVNTDGYVEISVEETNPHTGFERRYVLKHVWLWEQINGSVPADMCLKCVDGVRLNTDPTNWQLIKRALLPALNGGRFKRRPGYDQAAPELKPTLLVIAEVETRVRELKRRKASSR